MKNTAVVKFVWGITGLKRRTTSESHVLEFESGKPLFDPDFRLTVAAQLALKAACLRLSTGGDLEEIMYPESLDCFILQFESWLKDHDVTPPPGVPKASLKFPLKLAKRQDENAVWLQFYEWAVEKSKIVDGCMGFASFTSGSRPTFASISFKSKTNLGLSAFAARRDFEIFESLCGEFSKGTEGLGACFQTSDFWTRVFIEIVAVSGSLWGIFTSVLLCFASILVFTGHFGLSLTMISIILGVLATVSGVFYLLGFELGAVEAISLSVIIGTSSDYAAHLCEGYLHSSPSINSRSEKVKFALKHIGSPIFSSAVTTIGASAMLLFASIQLFSRFGLIVCLNTVVSVVFALVVYPSLLCVVGPVAFKRSWRASMMQLGFLCFASLLLVLALFLASKAGFVVLGPSGKPLFG